MKGICKNCSNEFNYNISQSTGIYCSNKCQGDFKTKQRFTKNTVWSKSMRKYLLGIWEYKCDECGISEYNGKPITLQVDHIDGDRSNNTFENLRLICPNCHSQTENWGIGNISEEGKERLLEGAKNGWRNSHK